MLDPILKSSPYVRYLNFPADIETEKPLQKEKMTKKLHQGESKQPK